MNGQKKFGFENALLKKGKIRKIRGFCYYFVTQ
jgi:hypothetical protein